MSYSCYRRIGHCLSRRCFTTRHIYIDVLYSIFNITAFCRFIGRCARTITNYRQQFNIFVDRRRHLRIKQFVICWLSRPHHSWCRLWSNIFTMYPLYHELVPPCSLLQVSWRFSLHSRPWQFFGPNAVDTFGQIGWRLCFISISIFSIFMGFLTFFFVRGNPIVYGYPAVNSDLTQNVHELTFHQRFHQLLNNFKTIFSNSNFWLILIFVFFCNGSFYNVNGIWGGPFLKESLSYSSVKASNALLGLSLGNNFGALLNPYVPDFTCKSKKWTTFVFAVVSISCCVPFAFCPEKLSFPVVVFLFTVFAVTSAGVGVIAYPLGIELFHPSCGASASGCLNCFAFLSSIIFMPLTGKILESFGNVPGSDDVHNPDGFKYGLWIFNIVGFSFGTFLFLFVRKPKIEDKIDDFVSNYESLK